MTTISTQLIIMASFAVLVLVATGVLDLTLSQSVASRSSDLSAGPHQLGATGDDSLGVTLTATQTDALPGDTIGFVATVENRTGSVQTDLRVLISPSVYGEALVYIPRSTYVRYAENRHEVSLPSPMLSRQPVMLRSTFRIGQQLLLKWQMRVSECVTRDRWTQIAFLAYTNEEVRSSSTYENIYLRPHTASPTHHFAVSHQLDTLSPAPGDPVRHTVRIANDGYMVLDNIVVHVHGNETIDRLFPTVAHNSTYYVVEERGGDVTLPIPIDDPGWSGPTTGFNLNFLNPGQTLVLRWTDYVAPDAPIGTEVRPRVDVRPDQDDKWTSAEARFTVSPRRDDLAINIQAFDPEYLANAYLPGDRVTIRVSVVNHTADARDDLSVRVVLPVALAYVTDSSYLCVEKGGGDRCDAPYGTQNDLGEGRRWGDDWLDDWVTLPNLDPGDAAIIVFRAIVREGTVPQKDLETRATLSWMGMSGEKDAVFLLSSKMLLDVVRRPDIAVSVESAEIAEPGGVVLYDLSIENVGETDLTNVSFGVEMTCGFSYVSDTMHIDGPGNRAHSVSHPDDAFLRDQRYEQRDESYPLGTLVAEQPGKLPGDKVRITLVMRIDDDIDPGHVDGPRFVINAENQGALVGGTTNVHLRARRVDTGVAVIERGVTAADFERVTTNLLRRIQYVTSRTQDSAERTEEATRVIRSEVGNVNPWSQGVWWIVRVGGFAVVASLIAGIVFPFMLVGVWKKWRRQATNPDLPAPSTPSSRKHSIRWETDRCRASVALLAAARERVSDLINGLWRR